VELFTADGVRLTATWWHADRLARGTVVLVHGFGAGSGEARVVALAEALRAHGFDVLAYDGRGHGASDGATTLGDDEHLDVAAAVAAVPPAGRPLVLVGASMGAIATLRYATAHPEAVAGVVTVSCPARWKLPRNARGVLSALLTQTPLGRNVARRHMGVRISSRAARGAPPVELVATLTVPLAVVHGRCDPFIAPEDGTLLYETAHEPRRLDLVEGLGHAFETPAVAPVLAAVDWCIDHAASPRQPAGAV
jgi:alpha-beta hydrolase superfamily lysophospholipase